jgi:ketosteroid isomerase-like protein
MSQENVEIVPRAFAAFNRTFTEGTLEFYEFIDPEVEWIPITALLEGTRYQGHDGVRQWIEDMKRDWEVFETHPKEFRDLGDDRVLVLGTWRAQGRGSAVELDFPRAAWVVRFRDGKIIRLQTFTDRELAFEAAGLQE